MAKKPRMPDLSNATPGFLVDELGKVRAELSKLKRLEGYYKEALDARWPVGEFEVEGEEYECERTHVTQVRLDGDSIKADMDEEWVKNHSKEISFHQYRINPK